jgi:hypothetical protein
MTTAVESKARQVPLIVKGHFRDKRELIKVAADKAKKELKFRGNATVVKIFEYDEDINGHLVVVEEARPSEYELPSVRERNQNA